MGILLNRDPRTKCLPRNYTTDTIIYHVAIRQLLHTPAVVLLGRTSYDVCWSCPLWNDSVASSTPPQAAPYPRTTTIDSYAVHPVKMLVPRECHGVCHVLRIERSYRNVQALSNASISFPMISHLRACPEAFQDPLSVACSKSDIGILHTLPW
jgi:hypothetical protein